MHIYFLEELKSASDFNRYLQKSEVPDNLKKRSFCHTRFIQNLEAAGMQTVCIDEVQKAPVLFDTLKAEVDERRRPGRFALSGSTEFSKKTGVHESLTGRIALLRIFPLNQCEILQGKSTFPLLSPFAKVNSQKSHSLAKLNDIQLAIERGGMPGIFGVREKNNREALFESWIETTCTRD